MCGAWARPRAPPTPGVASAPAGEAAADGGLALACGGCPVQGFATRRSVSWEDETATVTAHMANGALAASVFSECTSGSNEVEIYGQAGRLQVSCHLFDGLEFLPAASFLGDIWTRLRRMTHVLQELPQAALSARQGGDLAASYRAEWRHFIDAIQQDAPVECTLEDGRRALQVVLAAAESSSLGKSVIVAQAPHRIMPLAAELAVKSGDGEQAS
jgi:predicted dehydrogenase